MKSKMIFSIFIVFLFLGAIPNFCGEKINNKKEIIFGIMDNPPYNLTPDWESANPDYSTGGELADINNDGWVDLVVSDGNDMGMGHVRLYLNDGNGHLPTTASWQSQDLGYNGHLDVADVDGDGWLDVAVAYLGSGSSMGPVARVYMNNNGVLSLTPEWSAGLIGHAFVVDFGDINNDGRPDLAVATGDSYSGEHFHTLVYLNEGGTLETTPSWQSSDQDIMVGVHWVDADNDGWLDLAGSPTNAQTRVYRNLGGVLETTASWFSSDSANQFGNLLTSGDINSDGLPDLFTVDNTQLGGSGLIKQYLGVPGGFFETTHSWGFYTGCGSAVALADVNNDSWLDLASGAWWDHTWIFLNNGYGFPSSPSWTSGVTSVVEKIVFGNVGPKFSEREKKEVFSSVANQRLFYLENKNIQKINTVKVDGVTLSYSEYMYSRDQGFVTVGINPSSVVEIDYSYSKSLDMVVTNWDPGIGNYLYYNQLNITEEQIEYIPDLECNGKLTWSDVKAGSTVIGSFQVLNVGDETSQLNWTIESYPNWGTWTIEPNQGIGLTPEQGAITVDVNVVAPKKKNSDFAGQIKVVNMDNSSDYETISVSLNTPVNKQRMLFLFLEHIQQLLQHFGIKLKNLI